MSWSPINTLRTSLQAFQAGTVFVIRAWVRLSFSQAFVSFVDVVKSDFNLAAAR